MKSLQRKGPHALPYLMAWVGAHLCRYRDRVAAPPLRGVQEHTKHGQAVSRLVRPPSSSEIRSEIVTQLSSRIEGVGVYCRVKYLVVSIISLSTRQAACNCSCDQRDQYRSYQSRPRRRCSGVRRGGSLWTNSGHSLSMIMRVSPEMTEMGRSKWRNAAAPKTLSPEKRR